MAAIAIKSIGWTVFDALSNGEDITSFSSLQWREYLKRKGKRMGA
jgi:hypothetical protein